MPAKKKSNTPGQADQTQPLALPEPQEFQHYLKNQARQALRVLLERVMEEELTAF